MKIRRLTVKNIASIESAELDFEHGALGAAPLFLICGETGSGKTTILDAISLALYGKTPRYTGAAVRDPREIGGYAFNDMRQLVRRGAKSAEAKVELTGNDGKRYEATWSVTPGRQARTANTLTEHWEWKDCSPGGMVARLEKEKKAMARAATGLEFEQFCRTTMLAQGQFTRFLLGTEDEKADILEKLTDTSRYSELGKAIAAKYSKLDGEVRQLEAEISRMSGLGDQRAVVEARIAELDGIIAGIDGQVKSATSRLGWLKQKGELSKNRELAIADMEVAYAALKALERKTVADIGAAKSELKSLTDYFAENDERGAMYQDAGVILTNLADVRQARKLKAEAESDLETHRKSVPVLEGRLAKAKADLAECERKVSVSEAEVDAAERKLEAMDLKSVQRKRSDLEKRMGNIQGLVGKMDSVETAERSVASREKAISGKRAELETLRSALQGLKSSVDAAEAALAQAKAECDVQRKLIKDGIQKIVAELNVGDVCPICGNRIERLNDAEHFKSLFDRLNLAVTDAEAEYRRREREYNAAKASASALDGAIASEVKLADAERTAARGMRAEIVETAGTVGITAVSRDGFKAAIDECLTRIGECDSRIEEIESQRQEVGALRKVLRKLESDRNAAKDGSGVAERALGNLQNAIDGCQKAIKSEGDRAESKLKAAGEKAGDPSFLGRWAQAPEAVERELSEAAGVYVANKERLPRAQALVDQCEESARQVSACLSRAIAVRPDLEKVGPGVTLAKSTAEVDGIIGRLVACEQSLAGLEADPPQGLEASDSVESLGKAVGELNADKDKSVGERGRCVQQLADDDKCAEDRQAKRKQADAVSAEREEWRPIHEHFGDADGKKLRREIQSYVLANVLVKANFYLNQLSDRYVLSCEGLTLSVADGFEGGAMRPVNTLSGGEQFLVSLSLALGLAGMGDMGLSVDMLFIDEGFGTLSGEHLNSAIEALERLNSLTGSHKVGVISHVERLRERIPTHVEVSRTGHDPSVVKVVVNGRQE